MPTFHLDAQGYFHDGSSRIFPVGANYWPASCGVEMWQQWPAEEIRKDLTLLKSLGGGALNTLRFFLRWQDFEPSPGTYDESMFDKLHQLLRWCDERAILAHPSLFVGFMSGGRFWPAWKNNRNLFTDPEISARAFAFARRATEVIADHKSTVLAIDHGNELCCLPESSAAPPAAVIAWCAAINENIRSVWPDALTVSGNEQNQILNDTGFRLGQQPGCDLYSMHGYPVPAWHNVAFDGMTDPLCQSLLPLYTKIARAFGPVMLQEFGTIVTFGKKQQDAYLRAMLPAAFNSGANSFLWWCLKDIHANVFPYTKNGFESELGLVDSQNRIKPGLEYFLEFCKDLPNRAIPKPDPQKTIGLYLPRHYYHRDNPHAINNPATFSKHLIVANHLLTSLGYQIQIVRADQNLPSPAELKTLLIPSFLVPAQDVPPLTDYVRSGGHLLWHGPDPINWGTAYIELLGAKPIDYRLQRPAQIAQGPHTWKFPTWPSNMRVEIIPESAAVWALDEETRHPMLIHHRLGTGRVLALLPQPEPAIAQETPNHSHWASWYTHALNLLNS